MSGADDISDEELEQAPISPRVGAASPTRTPFGRMEEPGGGTAGGSPAAAAAAANGGAAGSGGPRAPREGRPGGPGERQHGGFGGDKIEAPSWSGILSEWNSYKRKVAIWEAATSALPEKRAPQLMMKLSGTAWDATEGLHLPDLAG